MPLHQPAPVTLPRDGPGLADALPMASMVIPARNASATLAACIEAALASRYPHFEVVIVDDASDDETSAIAARYPCRLVRLRRRHGAAAARNAGAAAAAGEILFFTDADCQVEPDALALAVEALAATKGPAAIGGSYTPIPADPGFYSAFQSVFVNHFETAAAMPDYVATHALAIRAADMATAGGFPDLGLPILEDVAFSHRFRRNGGAVLMRPDLLVRHHFGFDLRGSLANAVRKTRHWVAYSLDAGDLLADSGTASRALKLTVAGHAVAAFSSLLAAVLATPEFLLGVMALLPGLLASRRLILSFRRHMGRRSGAMATSYYLLVYPFAIEWGTLLGMLDQRRRSRPE